MAMNSSGVSHIAVCVRDLDKALAFYRDILGMTVTVDRVQDTSTGGLAPRVLPQPVDTTTSRSVLRRRSGSDSGDDQPPRQRL